MELNDDIFAKVRAKQDKLFADFSTVEATILEGIVSPSGLGAGIGGEICHLTFSTLPWRRQGGGLVHQEATVHKRCSKAEVDAIFETLSVYSSYRIEGKVLESPEGWDGPQIELLRIIESDLNDPELEKAVGGLQTPIAYPDAGFGAFVLDRRVNRYEAQTTWMGVAIRLSLDSEDKSGEFPQETLRKARILWEDAKRWDSEIRSYMLRQLLNLKNESWLEEGGEELTGTDFLRQVSLSSVTIYEDGSFEFWYDDGDLFWGHTIMVSGSLEEGLGDAGIHG